MNTLALVQMAREFAECGREDDAQRVMDEACDGLAEPVRQTAIPDLGWGNMWRTPRSADPEMLRDLDTIMTGMYEAFGISRVSLAQYNAPAPYMQLDRTVTWDEARAIPLARLSGLQRQLDECMDRAKSLTMWQSSFSLPRRVGKVGGVLSRELWRSAQ